MPAPPGLTLPDVFAGVELPATDGKVLTKSVMLAGAVARSSSVLITLTGVGAE
jgi:hypothetical protein